MSKDDPGGDGSEAAEILRKILNSNEIDRHGFRISLWSAYYTNRLFAEIEALYGLHRDENNVLFSLTLYGEMTAKNICNYTGRPRNTVSRAVDRLIRKNLIIATVDPLDRRKVLLNITPDGETISRKTMEMARTLEHQMLSCLSPVEKSALDAVLAKLMENAPQWMSGSRKRAARTAMDPGGSATGAAPAKSPKAR